MCGAIRVAAAAILMEEDSGSSQKDAVMRRGLGSILRES